MVNGMPKTKKWETLRARMTPEQRERARRKTEQLLADLPLHELRRARQLTQEQLAEALGMDQGNISKLERRTDMYVSTLRKFVEALGGELEVVARFPEGSIRIDQFREE
jgi:DNA-binding Xre family transcriptional regulator